MTLADAISLTTELLRAGSPRSAAIAPRADAEATPRSGALGRDDFLKMLLAQLQHQDPLNPQDATEFTAQLATFSMLEQLIEIQAGIARVERLLEDAVRAPLADTASSNASASPRAPVARLAAPGAGR
jgi:flagellar hook assembly protein FlgD